jgi:hypothetical protein
LGKVIQEIQEYNFSNKNSSSYDLGIAVSQDRLAYYISDKQGDVLLLRSSQIRSRSGVPEGWFGDLKSTIQEDADLRDPFHSMKTGVVNPFSVLVPARLYKKEEARTYLGGLLELDEEETSHGVDYIPSLDTYNVFAIDHHLSDWLKDQFPGHGIHHISSGLLEAWLAIAKKREGAQVFINVFDRFFLIAYFERGELIFSNHFTYRTSKDFLYFAMLAYDQFRLAPENIPASISGLILPDSEIHNLLFRYIKDVRFLPAPSFLNFSPQFEQIPGHQYFDLFSLELCG